MQIKLTLDVTADSEAVMEKHFSAWLSERGWHCVSPDGHRWEPLGKFVARIGIDHDCFHRRWSEWKARGNYLPCTRDKRNYLKEILSSPEFDLFCAPK